MNPSAISIASTQSTAIPSMSPSWETSPIQNVLSDEAPKIIVGDEKETDPETYITEFIARIKSEEEKYIALDQSFSAPTEPTKKEQLQDLPSILQNIEDSQTLTPGKDVNLVLRYASMVGDEVVIQKVLEKIEKDDIEAILLSDKPWTCLIYAAWHNHGRLLEIILDFMDSKGFMLRKGLFRSVLFSSLPHEKNLDYLLKYLYSHSLLGETEEEKTGFRDRILEDSLLGAVGWVKPATVKGFTEWVEAKKVRVDYDMLRLMYNELLFWTWKDPCQSRTMMSCDNKAVREVLDLLDTFLEGKVNIDGYRYPSDGWNSDYLERISKHWGKVKVLEDPSRELRYEDGAGVFIF